VAAAPAAGVDRGALRACERYLGLLVDLLSQLPTRRFLTALVAERGVVVRARMAAIARAPAGTLFTQLLDQLAFYTTFPIDDHSGGALSDLQLGRRADDAVLQLQRLLFARWPLLRALALTNCASVRSPAKLAAALAPLTLPDLQRLAVTQLRLVRAQDAAALGEDFVRAAVVAHFASRVTPRAAIAAMPLYPTEVLLWDEQQIPSAHYAGDAPLALPKLNLQFLTFWDYLLRNFNLFRLEATYEIREDVNDTLKVRCACGHTCRELALE
jgi:intron-binding protein aquarius